VESFLRVVLDRVPKGESIGGRSHCVCGARIPIWCFWLEVTGAVVALGILWLVIG
jgi:hypothetical protein